MDKFSFYRNLHANITGKKCFIKNIRQRGLRDYFLKIKKKNKIVWKYVTNMKTPKKLRD